MLVNRAYITEYNGGARGPERDSITECLQLGSPDSIIVRETHEYVIKISEMNDDSLTVFRE